MQEFTQNQDKGQGASAYSPSRYALLRAWMLDQTPVLTMVALAQVIGMASSSAGRALSKERMQVDDHAALVALGIPPELLPRPENVRPGPRPRQENLEQ